MMGEYRNVQGAGQADGLIDAATESLTFDISEVKDIVLNLVQVTDAGTVVLVVEGSIDGTQYTAITSKADTDFSAGANIGLDVAGFSDANGMPKAYKTLRVRASALAGGGVYKALVGGHATR